MKEKLTRIDTRVTSPDGDVQGRMRHGSGPQIRFRPGTYRRYDATTLSGQLTAVVTSLLATRRREHTAVWAEFRRSDGRTAGHWHQPTREFRDRRRQVVAESAPSRFIRVGTKGMREFQVRVSPEALSRLDEERFTALFRDAAASLSARYTAAVRELREEYRRRGVAIR